MSVSFFHAGHRPAPGVPGQDEPQGAPAGSRQRVYDSVLDLLPGPDNPSPMLRLGPGFDPSPRFRLHLKLEGFNPFGSIKDRTAYYLLRGTALKPGQSLVEPSSGNTGIALAALANLYGIPIEIAVPEGVPEEKKALLRLLGAEVVETPDELCPLFPSEGARGVVKSMVESAAFNGRYVSPNQYENPLNVEAHYRGTGPEIWEQTAGAVTHFFAGFGTCGTITGVARYLKERNPAVRIIGVEPATREHRLSGMKRITDLPEDLAPRILDRSLVDEIIPVGDDEAFETGLRLARKTGLLVGPTTGAVLFAALQAGARESGNAVVISPDNATRYMSAYSQYLARREDPAGEVD